MTNLPEIEQILSDVRTAAGALDIVFEIVRLYAAAGMTDRAEAFSTHVPAGKAGEFADTLEREGSVTFEGATYQELALVSLIRAVAAAGMSLAAVRRGAAGEASEWLEKARKQVKRFLEAARVDSVGEMGKYVAAAELAVTGELSDFKELGIYLATAWLLWEYGHPTTAAQLAQHGLDSLQDPFDGLPQVVAGDMMERHAGCFIAARIGLASLLAVQFAADGKSGEARDVVSQEESRINGYGWAALTVGEQSEVYAFLAIARHACGDLDSALQYLRTAIEPAPTLAGRGDLQAFKRLCQALTQILPPDAAVRFWVPWLVAAAANGARETMVLLSILIPLVRDEDVARVTVDPEGRMVRKEQQAAEAEQKRSSLYEFFGMSGGASGGQ
jgi:tetratricopeptide (TPR) repeat protein